MTAVMTDAEVAVIVGVGPGLGIALGKRFAAGGAKLALAARDAEKVRALADEAELSDAKAFACDVGDRGSVAGLFQSVEAELGSPDVIIFNAGSFSPGSILDYDPEAFEQHWRVGCLGGFHVGQLGARVLAEKGKGTLIFTGATASRRGGPKFAALAVPKFGLKALAESMARELGPMGVHVAHVIIDGMIDLPRTRQMIPEAPTEKFLNPDAIAETYFQLHQQDPSAWTFELDLRPHVEKW